MNNRIDNPIVFVNSVNREMTYAEFIEALFKHDTKDMEHMHAALGVAGEAGELADAIKKHVVYGKILDRANIVEELGDLRFYMQQIMNMHEISEDEVLQGNANKLSKRYPKGEYSDVAAVARLDKVEFNPHHYYDWLEVYSKDVDHTHIWHSKKANGYTYSDEASQLDTTLYATEAEAKAALEFYIKNNIEPKQLNWELRNEHLGHGS